MCMYVQKYIHKKAQKVLFTHHLLFHELCNSLAFFLIIKPNPIYGHCKCTSNTNYENLLKQQFYLVDIYNWPVNFFILFLSYAFPFYKHNSNPPVKSKKIKRCMYLYWRTSPALNLWYRQRCLILFFKTLNQKFVFCVFSSLKTLLLSIFLLSYHNHWTPVASVLQAVLHANISRQDLFSFQQPSGLSHISSKLLG